MFITLCPPNLSCCRCLCEVWGVQFRSVHLWQGIDRWHSHSILPPSFSLAEVHIWFVLKGVWTDPSALNRCLYVLRTVTSNRQYIAIWMKAFFIFKLVKKSQCVMLWACTSTAVPCSKFAYKSSVIIRGIREICVCSGNSVFSLHSLAHLRRSYNLWIEHDAYKKLTLINFSGWMTQCIGVVS